MSQVIYRPVAIAGNPLPPSGKIPRGWLWLLLPCLALWPVWHWSALRLSDGSDDPFGIIAMLALLALVVRDRRALAATPRLPWYSGSLALCLLAGPWLGFLPPLLRATAGVCALLCGVLALRRQQQPVLAWFGLGILALPLMSSLQFFAGYPLRVVTAEASMHLLRLFGLAVSRDGTTLDLAGRLVMVDAPCSGIQMAWSAYFTACTAAAWLRLPDRTFLRRLPSLGLIVLSGNILRNSMLVLKESGALPLPAWTHEGIGLLVFAAVCVLVLRLVARPAQQPAWQPPAASAQGSAGRSRMVLVSGFMLATILPLFTPHQTHAGTPRLPAVQWPEYLNGRPLRPLPLSAVEQAFAAGFPGAIARFSDGESTITLRHVTRATRKLHPATDCYRGLGYRISTPKLSLRPGSKGSHGLQRCFVASRNGRNLLVCEHIEDQAGRSFTDTSAWYWAAVAGETSGPWQAVTTARLQ